MPGQFAQLLALYEQDGLTQAELCARVRIEQPTMANTLARMQRDGLIDRVPDPADGRRALVTLTPRARDLQDQLIAAAADALRARGLPEGRATLLAHVCTAALAHAVRAWVTDPFGDLDALIVQAFADLHEFFDVGTETLGKRTRTRI